MTKTELAKKAASLVVGVATGKVVKEVIKNNTDPDNGMDKAAVVVGGYILGALAADAAWNVAEAKIDKLTAWWSENVKDQTV